MGISTKSVIFHNKNKFQIKFGPMIQFATVNLTAIIYNIHIYILFI